MEGYLEILKEFSNQIREKDIISKFNDAYWTLMVRLALLQKYIVIASAVKKIIRN